MREKERYLIVYRYFFAYRFFKSGESYGVVVQGLQAVYLRLRQRELGIGQFNAGDHAILIAQVRNAHTLLGLRNRFPLDINQCFSFKQIEISGSDLEFNDVGHLLLSKLCLFQTRLCLLHRSPRCQTVEDWEIERKAEVPYPVHLDKSFVVIELIVGKEGEGRTAAGLGDINLFFGSAFIERKLMEFGSFFQTQSNQSIKID